MSEEIETAADLELLVRFARTATQVGCRALDVGTGTGRVARLLADNGLDAVGVDVADGMVHIARREHPDLGFTPPFQRRVRPQGVLGFVSKRQ